MNRQWQRRLSGAIAVLAIAVLAAKVIKAAFRAETVQSRVKPLN